MTLTIRDRRSISRMVGLGVPTLEIAEEFGIRVRDVQRIDHVESSRRQPRTAEPIAPRAPDWKTARPASELYLPSDTCKWPSGDPQEPGFHFCGHARLAGYPYCRSHADRAYQARAAWLSGCLNRQMASSS